MIDHIPPPPHWEWADGPTECTFLLAQDFKAAMWESRIPYAPYREYISRADMTSAYRYYRRALEMPQSNAPGRWVLKMPAHAYFIDAVLAEYPDARIVWTHRDPVVAVTSFMNLNAFAHRLSMGTVDHEWIADTVPVAFVEQVHWPMAALADEMSSTSTTATKMADPLGVMADLYEVARRTPDRCRSSAHAGLARCRPARRVSTLTVRPTTTDLRKRRFARPSPTTSTRLGSEPSAEDRQNCRRKRTSLLTSSRMSSSS